MTALSTQERDELHKSIWTIANDLRGNVDGRDVKQYVLGMMFYRYISENLTVYLERLYVTKGKIVRNKAIDKARAEKKIQMED